MGIVKNNSSYFRTQGTYLQKEIKGKPLSVFFLVKQESIVVFGFCENLYEKKYGFPYFYQGLVGPIRLSIEVEINVLKIVKKVVDEFNLIEIERNALNVVERLLNTTIIVKFVNIHIQLGQKMLS